MTKIIIRKDKDGSYRQLSCTGHTGYENAGKDIVCAAVSVLVINTVNALEELAGEQFTVKQDEASGSLKCLFETPLQERSVFLLDAMVYGLQHIQEEYGKRYLQVKFEEV